MAQETKEIKITVPEGMEIDKENSTFEKIVFKKKEEIPWRYDEDKSVGGFVIVRDKVINTLLLTNIPSNHNVFATEKQAKSALAMAQISQIMANDERFGGVVTDKEWEDSCKAKHIIYRCNNDIACDVHLLNYSFLAFHTKEQRDLFLQENEDLVKDYLMVE